MNPLHYGQTAEGEACIWDPNGGFWRRLGPYVDVHPQEITDSLVDAVAELWAMNNFDAPAPISIDPDEAHWFYEGGITRWFRLDQR